MIRDSKIICDAFEKECPEYKYRPADEIGEIGAWDKTGITIGSMGIYRRKKVVEPPHIDVPLVMGERLILNIECPYCSISAQPISQLLMDKHCLGFVWDVNGREYIRSEYVSYRMNDGRLYKDFGVNNTEKYKKEYAKAVRFRKDMP